MPTCQYTPLTPRSRAHVRARRCCNTPACSPCQHRSVRDQMAPRTYPAPAVRANSLHNRPMWRSCQQHSPSSGTVSQARLQKFRVQTVVPRRHPAMPRPRQTTKPRKNYQSQVRDAPGCSRQASEACRRAPDLLTALLAFEPLCGPEPIAGPNPFPRQPAAATGSSEYTMSVSPATGAGGCSKRLRFRTRRSRGPMPRPQPWRPERHPPLTAPCSLR
mmetsp:Transcript_9175/g.24017  ORF Transcript_9175/g.24017 Transcript_9175/m.24017 type:complete len:217 (+) Transcript_9175:292-942(+)